MAGFLAYPAVAPPSHHFLDSDDSVECVCATTWLWETQQRGLSRNLTWFPFIWRDRIVLPSTKMRCKGNEKFLVLKY